MVSPLLRRPSPQMILLENVQVRRSEPWLEPKDLDNRRADTNDTRCVVNPQKYHRPGGAGRCHPTCWTGSIVRGWKQPGTPMPPDCLHPSCVFLYQWYDVSRIEGQDSGRTILRIRTLATCKSREGSLSSTLTTQPQLVTMASCILSRVSKPASPAGGGLCTNFIAHTRREHVVYFGGDLAIDGTRTQFTLLEGHRCEGNLRSGSNNSCTFSSLSKHAARTARPPKISRPGGCPPGVQQECRRDHDRCWGG